MQLADKSGIKCDLCGKEYRHDFVYYSLDMKIVQVQNNRHPPGAHDLSVLDGPPVTLDACATCMLGMENATKANYKPTSTGVNCDLCGTQLRGSFSYYYCKVTKADVSMTGATATCQSCKALVRDVSTPCACGGASFTRNAAVRVDDKYLQLMICGPDQAKIAETIARMRG